MQITRSYNESKNLSDIEWFDWMCEMLSADNSPIIDQLVGKEKPNPNNEVRGSLFLIPEDNRFERAFIWPKIENDWSIDYLGFSGSKFSLKISSLIDRFSKYRVHYNFYDENTQVFFYPVSNSFAFTGFSLNVDQDNASVDEVKDLVANNITFYFGSNLTKDKFGFRMIRNNIDGD